MHSQLQIKILRDLTLFVICVLISCSSSPRKVSEDSSKVQSIEAKPMQGQLYRTFNDNKRINIVSSDELEIQEGGINLICKYTKQGETLRVVTNVMGTSQALYFQMIPEGIVDNEGVVFYTPKALETAKESARLAREKAAEQQRQEIQRQEEERRHIDARITQSKIVSKVISERSENVILRPTSTFFSITKTIITDVDVTFSGDYIYGAWSSSQPNNTPFKQTYWFGDFTNIELKVDEVFPWRGGHPKGLVLYFSNVGYELFLPEAGMISYAEILQNTFQSWKTKYADIVGYISK